MKQEILFDEMVLGNAVWDDNVLEKPNPAAWCGTPMAEEIEKRAIDLSKGMFRDLDNKSILIDQIKLDMRELPKEEYDLSFGGDGFDRLDPIF